MYVGVREFLSETVHSFLGRCDFKRVGASLRAANVISVGEFQRLQACPQLEDANRFLYSLLDGDLSTRKLGALSAALKDDTTHDGHQELAQLIDQFLQGEDIAVGVVIYISNYNLHRHLEGIYVLSMPKIYDIINPKYSPFILISQYIFYYCFTCLNHFLFCMGFVGPSTSQSEDPTTTDTNQTSNIVRSHCMFTCTC